MRLLIHLDHLIYDCFYLIMPLLYLISLYFEKHIHCLNSIDALDISYHHQLILNDLCCEVVLRKRY